MSELLLHTPAHIIRAALVALGVGTLPSSSSTWPIQVRSEPDSPDNVITVFNTVGSLKMAIQKSGEIVEGYGIQVRIRAATDDVAGPKAESIATILDETLYDRSVALDGSVYLIHCVNRSTGVISIGEGPGSNRSVYTIDAEALITKTN